MENSENKVANELAYLFGVIYGDGTVYKKSGGAYATTIDQKNGDFVKNILKEKFLKLGFNPIVYPFSWKGYKKWRVSIYSKSFFQTTKLLKERPMEIVKNMGSEDFLHFVAGLFDAEGSITDRINIYNSNKELLIFIQEKLRNFGIEVKIYRYGPIHGISIYRKSEKKKFSNIVPFQTKRNLILADNKNAGICLASNGSYRS